MRLKLNHDEYAFFDVECVFAVHKRVLKSFKKIVQSLFGAGTVVFNSLFGF
jgi:hypothetical protein